MNVNHGQTECSQRFVKFLPNLSIIVDVKNKVVWSGQSSMYSRFWFGFGWFGFCLVYFSFGFVFFSFDLILVWKWFGFGLVWFWFGLVLVWFWFWFGFGLVLEIMLFLCFMTLRLVYYETLIKIKFPEINDVLQIHVLNCSHEIQAYLLNCL